jgi:hypothetical protein
MATSYANNGGTGERRPEIVATTNIVSSGVDIGAGATYTYELLLVWVDGASGGTSLGGGGNARDFGNANNGADVNITFDFGVNASVVIDEMKVYISGTTSFGTWTIDGSNNNSTWTTLKSAFTLTANNAAATVCAYTNSTGYRYYRFHTTSAQNMGGGSGSWSEFEFKISDATQSTRCSWFNTNGKGARTGTITTSTTLTFSSGVIANLVDGDQTNNSSHAVALNTGQSGASMTFDFGAGVVIDTYFLWQQASTNNTQGTWKLQGSANNSSWTDLESANSLINESNLTVSKHTVSNTTSYRYYRLLQTSGSTTTPTFLEMDFRIYTPVTSHPTFRAYIIG